MQFTQLREGDRWEQQGLTKSPRGVGVGILKKTSV